MVKISDLLKAAALSLTVAATPAEATITSLNRPSINADNAPDPLENQDDMPMPSDEPPSSFLVPPQAQISDQCRASIRSYFNEDSLRDIDAKLAGIQQWFVANKMPVPPFEEYEAGKPAGRSYLGDDPGNVVAAIEIYKNHVDLARKVSPEAMANFDKSQGRNLSLLSKISESTMEGLTQLIVTGCGASSPAPAPSL